MSLLALCGPSVGQEPTYGTLLLKESDRVISGKIAHRGEFYEVEIATDSRVFIPANKVAQVGKSLEDLYQTKRLAISQWSVGDHFQLARWCMVNDLLEHAAEHYSETSRRAPSHPRVKQLGVELADRISRNTEFRAFAGLPPLAGAASAQTAQAAPSNLVVTASTFEASGGNHPEIGRRFVEHVQPILMNRCSQAACHGAQSSSRLRLLDPYRRASPRTSSENLTNVLEQITHNSGLQTPLEHFATTPHGTQTSPAISLTETALLTELHNWIDFVRNPVVSAVVSSDHSTRPSALRSAAPPRFQPHAPAVALIPVEPGTSQLRQVPLGDGEQSPGKVLALPAAFPLGTFPLGTQPPSTSELDVLERQLKITLGELPADQGSSTLPNNSTLDPFDPAEFNRQSRSNSSQP